MAKGSEKGNTFGYAAFEESGKLSPFHFNRREVSDDEVAISITHCGMCHSDIHSIRNEWGASQYPMVPGHEIVGIVKGVGKNVKKLKKGDRAAVGCFVRSCKECDACQKGVETYCSKKVPTYSGKDWGAGDEFTQGGYSSSIVVTQEFVFTLPDNLPSDGAAPLLCAGITVYSPMQHFGLNEKGKSLGVVGLGGLGHMAVQFGKAFGLKVTVLSTSINKRDAAIKELGADNFVICKDMKQMEEYAGTLDYIIDTLSAKHDIAQYLKLLNTNGKFIILGLPPGKHEFAASDLIMGRKMIAGSLVGGVKETQDMLNFCGKHNIASMIECVPLDYVNTAIDRMLKNDVKYRFVIEVAKSLGEHGEGRSDHLAMGGA